MTERGYPRRKRRSGPVKLHGDYRSFEEVMESVMRGLAQLAEDAEAALAADPIVDRPDVYHEGSATLEEGEECPRQAKSGAEEQKNGALLLRDVPEVPGR